MSSHDDQDWGGGGQVDIAAKRAAWGATTPAQRLAWLESALTFAQSVGALDHDRQQREGEAMEWAAGSGIPPEPRAGTQL